VEFLVILEVLQTLRSA